MTHAQVKKGVRSGRGRKENIMKPVLSIDYKKYIGKKDINVGEAINVLTSLIRVNEEGYGKDAIYEPKQESIHIQVDYVRDDQIRPLTKEEKEHKELNDLKQQMGWRDSEIKDLKKKLENLECINKALCEQTESTTDEPVESREEVS